MVTGNAVEEAAAISADHPSLSIGLHWDVFGEDERTFDLDDLGAVHDEFQRQLGRFHEIFGRAPTHVDSHRHAHRAPQVMPVFEELVAPLGVPLRHAGPVRYVGHFYGQWKWLETDLERIGVPYLQQVLRDEIKDGWNELACHPGYVTSDFSSIYKAEREVEVQSLTDPRIKETIDELGIRLASFADYAETA
jgi:predicted glycoside hydrolase/deacetylase ChbG (UPF0249 family)